MANQDGPQRPALLALCCLALLAPFNIAPIDGDTFVADLVRPLVILQVLVGLGVLLTAWSETRTGNRQPLPVSLRLFAVALVAMVWLSALLSGDVLLGVAGATTTTAVVLITVATALVVRTSRDAALLIRWLVIGVSVAVVIGFVVLLFGRDLWIADLFRGQVTRLGLQTRLTKPWAHANVAGMAIGTALLLSVGFIGREGPATTGDARLRIRRSALGLQRTAYLLVLPLSLLLGVALTLTYSRGGLAATVIAAAVGARVMRSHVGLLAFGALLVLAAVMVSVTPGWSARSSADVAVLDYAASVVPPASLTLGPDDETVLVSITNRSARTWRAAGRDRIQLSARWLDRAGVVVHEDRWPLTQDVRPQVALVMNVVISPAVPDGTYQVLWDLLLDQEAYFLQFSNRAAPSVVAVEQSTLASTTGRPLVEPGVNLGRTEIWRIGRDAFLDNPVLGVGPRQLGLSAEEELEPNQRFPGGHAHNLLLEALATWGLLGTVPFLLLIGGAVIRAGRWAVSAERSGQQGGRKIELAVLLGLVMICFHSAVEWPINEVGTAVPFSILLGIAWSSAARHGPRRAEASSMNRHYP